MAKRIFAANQLTGGTAGCLDDIKHTSIADGNLAIVINTSDNSFYCYKYDASSSDSESSPDVIKPDSNSGNGRWVLTLDNLVSNTVNYANNVNYADTVTNATNVTTTNTATTVTTGTTVTNATTVTAATTVTTANTVNNSNSTTITSANNVNTANVVTNLTGNITNVTVVSSVSNGIISNATNVYNWDPSFVSNVETSGYNIPPNYSAGGLADCNMGTVVIGDVVLARISVKANVDVGDTIGINITDGDNYSATTIPELSTGIISYWTAMSGSTAYYSAETLLEVTANGVLSVGAGLGAWGTNNVEVWANGVSVALIKLKDNSV